MPLTNAALSASDIPAAILLFADFQDEPVRGAIADQPITVPSGLADADADCAGLTFPTLDSEVLQIGTVSQGEGGSDSFEFALFADPNTPGLLTAIENPALYLGRRVRLWLAIHDGGGTVTELRPLYRGYMTQPSQEFDGEAFVIRMVAENWLAVLGQAQNRTYMNSQIYDPGDLSDAVSKGMPPTLPGGGGSGGGGGIGGPIYPL